MSRQVIWHWPLAVKPVKPWQIIWQNAIFYLSNHTASRVLSVKKGVGQVEDAGGIAVRHFLPPKYIVAVVDQLVFVERFLLNSISSKGE